MDCLPTSICALCCRVVSLCDTCTCVAQVCACVLSWWSEATHGVASARQDQRTPYATNYAFPITTAMSFNRTLWSKTGEHIGREARAFMNVGNAYSTYWAPVINLARDPRWGRNIETPGALQPSRHPRRKLSHGRRGSVPERRVRHALRQGLPGVTRRYNAPSGLRLLQALHR